MEEGLKFNPMSGERLSFRIDDKLKVWLYKISFCRDFRDLSLRMKFGRPLKGSVHTYDGPRVGELLAGFLGGLYDESHLPSREGFKKKILELFSRCERLNAEYYRNRVVIRSINNSLSVMKHQIPRLTDTRGGTGGQIGEMQTMGANCYVNLSTGEIVEFTNTPNEERDREPQLWAYITFRVALGTVLGVSSIDFDVQRNDLSYFTIVSIAREAEALRFTNKEAEIAFDLAVALFNLGVDQVMVSSREGSDKTANILAGQGGLPGPRLPTPRRMPSPRVEY
ncbi:MAG: hypothetical protein PHS44_06750 [Candidatus Dojkabacteria bacterium]|jgi:hypothetical protein|nr:hypothetical protein [Candidatus Dojkabacteria bacterium]